MTSLPSERISTPIRMNVKASLDPTFVRDLSEAAYRIRLDDDCKGNTERMIAKDGDGGEKLRGRAAAYDPITRAYLKALGITR